MSQRYKNDLLLISVSVQLYTVYKSLYNSYVPHSPALHHHFVNGLGAPRRGRLDVTSFGLKPVNQLQEVGRRCMKCILL